MARGSGLFQDKEEKGSSWKGLARDGLIALAIVAIVLGILYAYAGVWPPLVVVESESMQHSGSESSLGVIDTGDMVFQQQAPTRESIITYVEGRASGYAAYGDFGDVIIFRQPRSAVPIIHRAILYATFEVYTVNFTEHTAADVPDLLNLPPSEWSATNRDGATTEPYNLTSLTIRDMGLKRDTDLTITFDRFAKENRSGFITMGDNNLRVQCVAQPNCDAGYDYPFVPRVQDVQGRARGEIPWLGLLKLTLQPTSDGCCPRGWGSTGPDGAPKNSWDSLTVTLIFLFALPFLIEYAGRGWTRFVSPHMPKINWPWKKRKIQLPNPVARRRSGDPTDVEGNPSTWDEPLDDEMP
jgi:signal peptidase I